jgi:thymidylate synthase
MNQFDEQYRTVIHDIMNQGYDELNERTGHYTKILPGVTFRLDQGFPLLTLRKVPIRLFIAEIIWYIAGTKTPPSSIAKYTDAAWKDFTEPDGTVTAAYGYRWRHHFGRDQLGQLIAHLQAEPHSRQAVVVTWDPGDDGLLGEGLIGTKKKNVPCPYTFTVNIIGNRLHLHNIVRSNDMMLGGPHDVAGFALLQHILAARLGVKVGTFTQSISNAHIYDIHYEQAWELVERTNQHGPIFLEPQADWFERAEQGDPALLEEIAGLLEKQYHPSPPIKGMKIVL